MDIDDDSRPPADTGTAPADQRTTLAVQRQRHDTAPRRRPGLRSRSIARPARPPRRADCTQSARPRSIASCRSRRDATMPVTNASCLTRSSPPPPHPASPQEYWFHFRQEITAVVASGKGQRASHTAAGDHSFAPLSPFLPPHLTPSSPRHLLSASLQRRTHTTFLRTGLSRNRK